MAKKDKVLEHTSALQQNRTDPDMKVKPTLIIHRIICYIVLVFFSILCLFFFYILLVNASRSHYDIMSGFSFLPGSQFINNFQSAISNTTIPVVNGVINSLIIATCTTGIVVFEIALWKLLINWLPGRNEKPDIIS